MQLMNDHFLKSVDSFFHSGSAEVGFTVAFDNKTYRPYYSPAAHMGCSKGLEHFSFS